MKYSKRQSPNYAKDGMKPFGLSPVTQKVGTIFSLNDQEKMKTLFYEMRESVGILTQARVQLFILDNRLLRIPLILYSILKLS